MYNNIQFSDFWYVAPFRNMSASKMTKVQNLLYFLTPVKLWQRWAKCMRQFFVSKIRVWSAKKEQTVKHKTFRLSLGGLINTTLTFMRSKVRFNVQQAMTLTVTVKVEFADWLTAVELVGAIGTMVLTVTMMSQFNTRSIVACELVVSALLCFRSGFSRCTSHTHQYTGHTHANNCVPFMASHSGRTSVFRRRIFPVQRLTYSGRVTTYVRCRSTNWANLAFHPFGVDKWVATL